MRFRSSRLPGTDYVCVPLEPGRHVLRTSKFGGLWKTKEIPFELGKREWRLATVELGKFRLLPDKDLEKGYAQLAACTANRVFDLVIY